MVDGARIDPRGYIEDDELLYRRVLPEHVDWKSHPPQPKSEAFSDRDFRISVDRAPLCGYDPTHTQDGQENSVCCLLSLDVRQIDEVYRGDGAGGRSVEYNIDIEAVPLSDNNAHAEIFGLPHISNDKVFRRLRHALVRRISWEGGIDPQTAASA